VEDLSPDILEMARVLIASGVTAQHTQEDMPRDDERPPYTVPEAAAIMRVHEATLYRAIQKGELRAFSAGSGGRAIRIPAGELDAFKKRRTIRPGQASSESCCREVVA
jgi:excisionase family DNA binding protein